MKVKIPKNFKVGAHKINVSINNKLMFEKQIYGDSPLSTNEIRLRTKSLAKSQVLQTYYHEKIHHILHCMNHELETNEAFVDSFANLLLQTDLTSKNK